MPQPAGRSGQMKLKWFMRGESLKPYTPPPSPPRCLHRLHCHRSVTHVSLLNPVHAKMFLNESQVCMRTKMTWF